MDDIVFILNREHEVIEANKSASKILETARPTASEST